MRKINFSKMVASGNDFVVIDATGAQGLRIADLAKLAKKVCDRKYGIGADGLLLLERSRSADVRMRIFNADGSEAQMCGNGARCVALYESQSSAMERAKVSIETRAGIIRSEINGDDVKIRLTNPKGIRLGLPVSVGGRIINVDYVNTGVPHVAVFVAGLENIDVFSLGKYIRYYEEFLPHGTNVNFVEVLSRDSIKVRTYERGVEDETLACGTGSVASAIIFSLKSNGPKIIAVHTQGKDTLRVHFSRKGKNISDVWLEGKARLVFSGQYFC